MTASPHHIGTLREGPLHASLKEWCAEEGDQLEMAVDGYVIDVVRRGLLIEVQTGGFSSLKRKLQDLLALGHDIRVLYPVPLRKSIVKIDPDGEVLSRRRSPKRGRPLDVFSELVSIPDLISEPGLEIELVLTVEDEYRKHDPSRAWRRKGWVIVERRLVAIEETILIAGPADLAALMPELPDTFTTSEIATSAGCPRRLAQQIAYCLRHTGTIKATGKRGNSVEYQMSRSATE